MAPGRDRQSPRAAGPQDTPKTASGVNVLRGVTPPHPPTPLPPPQPRCNKAVFASKPLPPRGQRTTEGRSDFTLRHWRTLTPTQRAKLKILHTERRPVCPDPMH